MYIGQYPSNISKTRRIALPAKFRRKLGKKFIITKWYERCLVIVSKNNWESLLESIFNQATHITGSVRDTRRFIYGSAFELDYDDQGRIVIPASLADYAKLGSEGVFVGLGETIELWDKTEWEKRETYFTTHAADLLEKISKDG